MSDLFFLDSATAPSYAAAVLLLRRAFSLSLVFEVSGASLEKHPSVSDDYWELLAGRKILYSRQEVIALGSVMAYSYNCYLSTCLNQNWVALPSLRVEGKGLEKGRPTVFEAADLAYSSPADRSWISLLAERPEEGVSL